MSREGRSSRNRVSILSWMWTIVLACIPGVNIIAMFLLAFLSKKQPKRSFAVASLILMLIVAILIFVAFLVFPAELLAFGEWLRDLDAPAGRGHAAGAVKVNMAKGAATGTAPFLRATAPRPAATTPTRPGRRR